MEPEKRDKAIDDMKERMLGGFLAELNNLAFVKSTNSVTGEVEIFPTAVEDLEGTIRISGEWDREDLKNMLSARTL